MSFTKGQEISVGNCGVFNSPKKPMKKIMGGKVVYRGVLPLHLKQTFPPIFWIFTEGEGDGIKCRLSS